MRPRTLLPFVLLLLLPATLPSCLYLPPMHHTHGAKAVTAAADAAPALNRSEVEQRLGKPGTLRKAGAYVYDWEQSYGYFFVGGYYTAAGGEITGKRFHVLVLFDGDDVQRYEWDADPPLDGIATRQPPLDRTPAGLLPASPGVVVAGGWCLAYSHDLQRCLVAVDAGGRAFAMVAADRIVAAEAGNGASAGSAGDSGVVVDAGERESAVDAGGGASAVDAGERESAVEAGDRAVPMDAREQPAAVRVAPAEKGYHWSAHAFVSADERYVVALMQKGNRAIYRCGQLWDLAHGTTRRLDENASGRDRTACRIIARSEAGPLVAVRENHRAVAVLDSASGDRLGIMSPGFNYWSVALGGNRAAFSSGVGFTYSPGDVAILDLVSGRRTAFLDGRKSVPRSLALSDDGRLLAAASATDIEIWDVPLLEAECAASGGTVKLLDGQPTDALLGVALLPASKVVPLESAIAIAPAGDLVAAASGADIRVVRPTGEHVAWLPAGGTVTRLRFDHAQPTVLQVFTQSEREPLTFDLAEIVPAR